jgi:hypothetical protein
MEQPWSRVQLLIWWINKLSWQNDRHLDCLGEFRSEIQNDCGAIGMATYDTDMLRIAKSSVERTKAGSRLAVSVKHGIISFPSNQTLR